MPNLSPESDDRGTTFSKTPIDGQAKKSYVDIELESSGPVPDLTELAIEHGIFIATDVDQLTEDSVHALGLWKDGKDGRGSRWVLYKRLLEPSWKNEFFDRFSFDPSSSFYTLAPRADESIWVNHGVQKERIIQLVQEGRICVIPMQELAKGLSSKSDGTAEPWGSALIAAAALSTQQKGLHVTFVGDCEVGQEVILPSQFRQIIGKILYIPERSTDQVWIQTMRETEIVAFDDIALVGTEAYESTATSQEPQES